MKKFKIHLIFIFLIILINNSYSQDYKKGYIDTVFNFKPGEGQNSGQSMEFFPVNIFGPPSTKASFNIAEMSESEICSIGLGGEIIVGFKDSFLYDGEGPDFTIFENAFVNPINQRVFAEPGVVSVSEDGINYIEFPFNSETLEGCAGTKPTIGIEDPFNPAKSGGNQFDLKLVNLMKIKYIKIKDYCEKILHNSNHQFYDPIISGFDLDAISAQYLAADNNSINEISNNLMSKYIIKTKEELYRYLQKTYVNDINISKIKIYDYIGNEIYSISKFNEIYNLRQIKSGIYLLIFEKRSSEISYLKVNLSEN